MQKFVVKCLVIWQVAGASFLAFACVANGAIVYSGLRDNQLRQFPGAGERVFSDEDRFGSPDRNVLSIANRNERFWMEIGGEDVFDTIRGDLAFVRALDVDEVIGGELEWEAIGIGAPVVDFRPDAEDFRGYFYDREDGYAAVRTEVDEEVYYYG